MTSSAPAGLVRVLLDGLSPQTMWNVYLSARLDTRTLEYRYLLRADIARHVIPAFKGAIFDRPYRVVARTPKWITAEVALDSLEDARRMVRAGGPFAGARLD